MTRWNTQQSAVLSIACTWAALALAVGGAVALPFLPRLGHVGSLPVFGILIRQEWPAMYLCIAGGMAALILLLKVLYSIKDGAVFTSDNVARLRWISYCGFAIAGIALITGLIDGTWLGWGPIGLVAAFLGLIMRVVKNVIDAARVLKEESDFTI